MYSGVFVWGFAVRLFEAIYLNTGLCANAASGQVLSNLKTGDKSSDFDFVLANGHVRPSLNAATAVGAIPIRDASRTITSISISFPLVPLEGK